MIIVILVKGGLLSLEAKFERVLRKLKLNRFRPFPMMRGGFWQTIYGAYWPCLKAPSSNKLHTVILPDGDAVTLVENKPNNWRLGKRIILLAHGACGSHQSPYMERMARRLFYS